MSETSRHDDYKALLQQAFFALEQMQSRLAASESARTEPIAIVGVGCRFPGGAHDPDAFWRLLRDGVDATCEVPPDRFDIDAYYAPDPTAPGKTNSRRGGFLQQIDSFDPQFFGISPREAALMDPQQRLVLEVAWEALEDAGLVPAELAGSATGVFVGVYNDDYRWLAASEEAADVYAVTGSAHCVVPGRLSFLLDLRGPSVAIDTACSSSLVAVHLACQSLRARECDIALAGGVNVILTPRASVLLSKLQVLAPDGRCKTFDARANGFCRGEGAGFIALKRLSDALAGGDRILAVIRGSAVNQDGHSVGLTAPNPQAQAALIRQVLAAARLDASDVSYIEAHGTGTPLGDPIEVEALVEIFGAPRPAERACLLGSVKTNLGHLEAAAGIAGLLKVVLSLQRGAVPPHLHLTALNPRISIEGTPLSIPTALTPWPAGAPRRCAGISSFGIGGTNAHVVVEEAPPLPARPAEEAGGRALLLPLSARSPEALQDQARAFVRLLSQGDAAAEAPIEDVCYSAGVGRTHHAHRLAVVANSRIELIDRLEASLRGEGAPSGRAAPDPKPKLVFVFPGQGSQWLGMGRRLMQGEPVFREALARCDEAMQRHVGWSLQEMLTAGEASGWLDRIDRIQPALFAIQVALAALWRSWGVEPDAVVGHSMGEIAAAFVAGALSLDDAARVVCRRSLLLRRVSGKGAMAVVELSIEHTQRALAAYDGRLSIAVSNSASSTVVSGDAEALRSLLEALQRENVFCRAVKVDVASHSPQMDPLAPELLDALAELSPQASSVPICSTVTGQVIDGRALDACYWVRNLREPVLFRAAAQRLIDGEHRLFIEVSPHPILVSAIEQALSAAAPEGGAALPSLRRDEDERAVMLESLGALHVRGYPVDFRRLYPGARRVALPTYPFQRIRCWIDPTPRAPDRSPPGRGRAAPAAGHPLVGARLRTAQPIFEAQLGLDALPSLGDHRIQGVAILPASAYLEMALAGAEAVLGGRHALGDVVLEEPLHFTERGERTVQLTCADGGPAQATIQIFSAPDGDGAPEATSWRRHFTAEARREGPPPEDLARRPPDEIRARCQEEVDVGAYYERLRGEGIELGPRFQGIQRLWRGDGEALGLVTLPEELTAEADAYHVHPILLDAALQVLGAALSSAAPDAAGDGALMLATIQSFRCHRRPGRRLLSHALALPGGPDRGSEASLAGEVRLLDDDGRVLAELTGLRLRRVSRSALLRLASARLEGWLYEVAWEAKALPAAALPAAALPAAALPAAALPAAALPAAALPAAALPAAASPAVTSIEGGSRRWLILSDRAGVGAALSARLRARGQGSVLVHPGDAYQAPADGHARVHPARPDDFERLLREAAEGGAPYEEVVHLWSLDAAPVDQPWDDLPADAALALLERASRSGCGSALLLSRALARACGAPPPRLWLVTQGAQAAGGAPGALAVPQSPLWGLGRGIALEHPELWGGSVDLGPGDPEEAARDLAAQISAGDGEDQAAFRNGARYVPRLSRSPGWGAPRGSPLELRADGAYLITGGLGGLGLKVAAWLAGRGARHLVLVGRSVLPDRAGWAALPAGSDVERRAAAIQALEALGATVQVASADVGDLRQMEGLLEQLGRTATPLRGVVHAAAASAVLPIQEMDLDALDAALRPKVLGGWILHRLTRSLPLDFFVLFSSTATVWGASGLAHYAAANQFLDALAHHRRSLGLPALVIDWGTWDEGRAASPEMRRWATRHGLLGMPSELALAALEQLLERGEGHKVVAAVDWSVLKPLHEAKRRRPLLERIQTAEPATAPGQAARPRLLQRLEDAPPAARRQVLLAHVQDEVARILRLPPSAPIDPSQGFFQIGMDSLTSIELKNRLQTALGRPLPTTLAFDHPTAEALADFLVKHVLQLELGEGQWQAQRSGPTRAPEAAAQQLSGAEIEELADDEAEALLAQRLIGLEKRLRS